MMYWLSWWRALPLWRRVLYAVSWLAVLVFLVLMLCLYLAPDITNQS